MSWNQSLSDKDEAAAHEGAGGVSAGRGRSRGDILPVQVPQISGAVSCIGADAEAAPRSSAGIPARAWQLTRGDRHEAFVHRRRSGLHPGAVAGTRRLTSCRTTTGAPGTVTLTLEQYDRLLQRAEHPVKRGAAAHPGGAGARGSSRALPTTPGTFTLEGG